MNWKNDRQVQEHLEGKTTNNTFLTFAVVMNLGWVKLRLGIFSL